MSRDNHRSAQSPEEVPIYLIAEEHLRKSEYLAARSDMRRTNIINEFGHTVMTAIKRSLIITSPMLVDRCPDLGEMEPYRRFLEGIDDLTVTF